MTNLKKAARQALEALEETIDSKYGTPLTRKAVLNLREALAEQVEQEPEYKGWYCAHCERGVDGSEVTFHEQHEVCGRVITNDVPPKPVKQEPVKREWVEPNDDLINDILMRYTKTELYRDDFGAFRAVLKLAKELNT